MNETITELAEKFAPKNGNWYVDTHESEIEVGMDTTDCFGGFIAALEDRDIEHRIVDDGEDSWVAYVYV